MGVSSRGRYQYKSGMQVRKIKKTHISYIRYSVSYASPPEQRGNSACAGMSDKVMLCRFALLPDARTKARQCQCCLKAKQRPSERMWQKKLPDCRTRQKIDGLIWE